MSKLALVIANTSYLDPGLTQLVAPGKDAEDFARILKSPEFCAFDEVRVLLNELEPVVREAIDELYAQKKPDDLLVLYFSGHGIRDELGALYLAVKNTSRFHLRSTAIKSDFIRESMDLSRSKRQILILDCCNSGAFALGTKSVKGVSLGIGSAFEGTGYGRIVLTASDSTQFAWEGDRIIGDARNSLFTHFLIKGLEGDADQNGDGRITVDDLYDYAYEQILSVTPNQTPSKWSYKEQGEIVLRQNMRIEDIKPIALPEELSSAFDNPLPYIREAAVRQLEMLLKGKNLGLARSARMALEKLAEEDDSRRVVQAANNALEPIRQAEQIAKQKLEEERLARENAEAENRANAKRLAREQIENEASEKAVREESSHLNTEITAPDETKLKSVEPAVSDLTRTQILPESAPVIGEVQTPGQLTAEPAEIMPPVGILNPVTADEIGTIASHIIEYIGQSLSRLKSISNIQKIVLGGLIALTLAFIALGIYRSNLAINANPVNHFYFSSNNSGSVNIFDITLDGSIRRLSNTPSGFGSWSPAAAADGYLYFASNRSGKTEIWRLGELGELKVTETPDGYESLSPSPEPGGNIYFASNRSGKFEIWKLGENWTIKVTDTPGNFESWSPSLAADGSLYFASNRSGKTEIWRILGVSGIVKVTDTPGNYESWSPAAAAGGYLYFASNRSGKTEIWRAGPQGTQQFTTSPGNSMSWAPRLTPSNYPYFSSDRNGRINVYCLDAQGRVVNLSSSLDGYDNWTGSLKDKNPTP